MLPVTRDQVATAFSLLARAASKARWKAAMFLFSVTLLLAGGAAVVPISAPASTTPTNLSGAVAAPMQAPTENSNIQVGQSYHHDVSPPLRDLALLWAVQESNDASAHHDSWLQLLGPNIPGPILVFEGISCPGCGLPRPSGEAGATQYVQVVSEAYQVFDKSTGMSILGPITISSLFAGFGGVCQNSSLGDSLLLYDQLADRWLISQFAGNGIATDACIAISTTGDATGTWYRYGFHLGSNFFIDPKLSVWPDGYYMSVNVFNSSGTAFLGPQPFAFDRTKMIAGLPPSFITPGITVGPAEASYLPADLDGSTMPPAGAPNSFVEFPAHGTYRVFHFHADFITPANSTFTLFASPTAAVFTPLCPGTRACVPQAGTTTALDGVGARLMFRLAYRNLGTASTPNESLVGNYSVSSGGVAGVHWFELKDVTSGPVVVAQESTYQPDTTWRWLGSAAMDRLGDLAIGFSASDSSINPQTRYAGRLATDPPNTLAQGEAVLFGSTSSQMGSSNWGDFSDLTIDPVDDCTFWYTNEYVGTPGSGAHTRIGSFKFDECNGSTTPTPTPSATPSSTPSPTPATPTPTSTPTLTPTPTPSSTPGAQALNLSTRLRVQTGDNVGIGGFIITGTAPKQVLLRGIGPSLANFGVPDPLADPVMELHGPAGFTTIVNDNWRDGPSGPPTPIIATGLAPTNDLESAILVTLDPGAYTAILRGKDNTSGVGLVEVYDLDQAATSKLANISTRAFVGAGADIVIAGFVLGNNTGDDHVLLRGIGPSLTQFGIPNALGDPTLELRDSNGTLLAYNNDWQDGGPLPPWVPNPIDPTSPLESVIAATLSPGQYTALLAGLNSGTGVGLVEVYDLESASP